jgi:hypothetical protein
MSCEQIYPLLTAWLDRELSAESSADVERHIADCLPCAHLAEQYREILALAESNRSDGTYAQACAADNTPDIEDDVEKRIQEEMQTEELKTEEITGLRRELEQMHGMVRALQAEVAQLRQQVNSQNRSATHIPGALMPGTQPAPDTARLQFLL